MWKTVKLGDICLVTDYVANGSFKSLSDNVKYLTGDGYAILVRLTDFTKGWNGNYKYVDKAAYNFLAKTKLFHGDLLISNVGEPGKTFLVPELGKPMTLAPNSILVRPDSDILNTGYLKYFIDSSFGKACIKGIESGTTQRKFNKTGFRNLEISLPPLAEQQRIVAKLDAAFAEIDTAVNLTTQKMARSKQAQIQLKDDAVKGLIEKFPTEILGKIAEFKNGMNYSKFDKGSFLKIVGVGDFKSNFFVDNTSLQTIGVKGISDDYLLKSGDILFVRSNGNKELIGRSMLVKDVCESMTFSGFSIRCRLNNEMLLPEFVCHILKSNLIRRTLIDGGGGSSISNLNQKMLSDIPMPIVMHDEQIRFLTRIQSLEENFEILVKAFTEKLNLLHSLKSAILAQELQSEAA